MQNPRSSDPDSPPHQCTQRTRAEAVQTRGNTCGAKHIIAAQACFRPGRDSKVGKRCKQISNLEMNEENYNPK